MGEMPIPARPTISVLPRVVWLGGVEGPELRYARDAIADVATVSEAATPALATALAETALPESPAVALLATAVASRWTLADATAISRLWPLTPVVSVATSLVEGRRRSGPPLPGVEEVAWCELKGRLTWWLADRAAGRPGTLGMPATARREERLGEPLRGELGPRHAWAGRVSVAAGSVVDLEGLCDLVSAAGAVPAARSCGRPAIESPGDVIVWDWGHSDPARLAWLRMLAAERPTRRLVVLESFPRGDSAQAAVRAGAAAVLARPTAVEAIAGTLLGLLGPAGNGLGQIADAG